MAEIEAQAARLRTAGHDPSELLAEIGRILDQAQARTGSADIASDIVSDIAAVPGAAQRVQSPIAELRQAIQQVYDLSFVDTDVPVASPKPLYRVVKQAVVKLTGFVHRWTAVQTTALGVEAARTLSLLTDAAEHLQASAQDAQARAELHERKTALQEQHIVAQEQHIVAQEQHIVMLEQQAQLFTEQLARLRRDAQLALDTAMAAQRRPAATVEDPRDNVVRAWVGTADGRAGAGWANGGLPTRLTRDWQPSMDTALVGRLRASAGSAVGRVLVATAADDSLLDALARHGVDVYGLGSTRALSASCHDMRDDEPLSHLASLRSGVLGGAVLVGVSDTAANEDKARLAAEALRAVRTGGFVCAVATDPAHWEDRVGVLAAELSPGRPLSAAAWSELFSVLNGVDVRIDRQDQQDRQPAGTSGTSSAAADASSTSGTVGSNSVALITAVAP